MLDAIKQQGWIRPLMPRLRILRRKLDTLRHTPALLQEEAASRKWAAGHFERAALIERALDELHGQGGYFGGWALSRSALRTFAAACFGATEAPLIVEWGSGQSTLFWARLRAHLAFRFVGVEHDPHWFGQLNGQLGDRADFHYLLCPLRQLSESERESLWQSPADAHLRFLDLGRPVPADQAGDTRLANAFYTLACAERFGPASIDGMVLDGPNGDGRSIVFPLLAPFLKPHAWVLLDDFDHYPFLEALGRLFRYELMHVQIKAGKRWCLIRLAGQR